MKKQVDKLAQENRELKEKVSIYYHTYNSHKFDKPRKFNPVYF